MSLINLSRLLYALEHLANNIDTESICYRCLLIINVIINNIKRHKCYPFLDAPFSSPSAQQSYMKYVLLRSLAELCKMLTFSST